MLDAGTVARIKVAIKTCLYMLSFLPIGKVVLPGEGSGRQHFRRHVLAAIGRGFLREDGIFPLVRRYAGAAVVSAKA
jgi:hypothetical protein